MKNGKPRGQTPSLIGGSLGRARKRTVQKKSSCNRCKAEILKGFECHEISQLGGSFSNYKPYCDVCFRSILDKMRDNLNALFKEAEDFEPD